MKLNNKNGYYNEYVCELAEASDSHADFIVKLKNALETLGINIYEKDGVTYKSICQLLKEIGQKWEKEMS